MSQEKQTSPSQKTAEANYSDRFDRLDDMGMFSAEEIHQRLGGPPHEMAKVALRATVETSQPAPPEVRIQADQSDKVALMAKFGGNESAARAAYEAYRATRNAERSQQGRDLIVYTPWDQLD